MAKRTKKQGTVREFSAGGVVFKREDGKILWLVRKQAVLPKSLYPKDIWNLPKGWLDDEDEAVPGPLTKGEKKATEEDLRKTALREVKEEGGVEVKIVEKIGTLRYFFTSTRGKALKFVTFYLMEHVHDLPEGHDHETEEIAWLPFEKARKKLSYSNEKKIISKAKTLLDSGIQENLI